METYGEQGYYSREEDNDSITSRDRWVDRRVGGQTCVCVFCVFMCVCVCVLADITLTSLLCTETTTMATPPTTTVAMATVTTMAEGQPGDGYFLPHPQVSL